MNETGRMVLTVFFGILGILSPMASIFVATFAGRSELSALNSMGVMFLAVFLMVFLIIDCFRNFNTNNKKTFIIGILFLLLSMISFLYHLTIFITL